MLFNFKTQDIHKMTDCLTCEHFDKIEKKCLGFGKICFEYDPKTKTCLDPITKLPIKLDKIKEN